MMKFAIISQIEHHRRWHTRKEMLLKVLAS